MTREPAAAQPQRASFAQTLRAVGASFFGVRGSSAHARDARQLHPLHVIVAGLLLAACFVLVLIFIVRAVVGA